MAGLVPAIYVLGCHSGTVHRTEPGMTLRVS
jgi:hypothetical protein